MKPLIRVPIAFWSLSIFVIFFSLNAPIFTGSLGGDRSRVQRSLSDKAMEDQRESCLIQICSSSNTKESLHKLSYNSNVLSTDYRMLMNRVIDELKIKYNSSAKKEQYSHCLTFDNPYFETHDKTHKRLLPSQGFENKDQYARQLFRLLWDIQLSQQEAKIINTDMLDGVKELSSEVCKYCNQHQLDLHKSTSLK